MKQILYQEHGYTKAKSPTFYKIKNNTYWHLLRHGLENTLANKKLIEEKESTPYLEAGYEVQFLWEV